MQKQEGNAFNFLGLTEKLSCWKRVDAVRTDDNSLDVLVTASACSAADKALISLLHAESRQEPLLHVTPVSVTIAGADKMTTL